MCTQTHTNSKCISQNTSGGKKTRKVTSSQLSQCSILDVATALSESWCCLSANLRALVYVCVFVFVWAHASVSVCAGARAASGRNWVERRRPYGSSYQCTLCQFSVMRASHAFWLRRRRRLIWKLIRRLRPFSYYTEIILIASESSSALNFISPFLFACINFFVSHYPTPYGSPPLPSWLASPHCLSSFPQNIFLYTCNCQPPSGAAGKWVWVLIPVSVSCVFAWSVLIYRGHRVSV